MHPDCPQVVCFHVVTFLSPPMPLMGDLHGLYVRIALCFTQP